MKKILIIISMVLILVGCGKKTPQPTVDENAIKEPDKVVTITDNAGTNNVTIGDITIKNVIFVNEDEKNLLEFSIESEKPIPNISIEVSLLSETVVTRSMKITPSEESYSKFIIFDFTGSYNNPYQVHFNIEKI